MDNVQIGSRTADPYRDLDVIDARAPRFNQATVALVTLAALATGWWPLLGVMSLQLAVGLTFGRRYCLPCVLYFEVVQPRFGEGPIEDARPPRFANVLGALFLGAATLLHVAGLALGGWIVAGLVAALASLAAVTGFCLGCEIYRLAARVRGIRPHHNRRLELADFGVSSDEDVVVQFTHRLCSDCHRLAGELEGDGRRLVLVDVSERADLARKYGVSVVPAAFAVGPEGRVLERIA